MSLGKFSVKNPVLVDILMVAILVLGLISFVRLPRELMSDISFSWVFIAVPYPGVSAEEIEKNVTIKIEDEISDVDKIKKISSITREGMGFVNVEFEDKVSKSEFARLYQDLRAEFDKVTLPDGTLDPWVDDFSTSDFIPLITVILNAKDGIPTDVINRTAISLQERILDVKDVSKADIIGGRDREIWVEADRYKLESFGISLEEVIRALGSRNLSIPGGTIDAGTRSYVLRTLGKVASPSDLGKVIVRRRPGKGIVHVRDVAGVNSGYADSEYDVRSSGRQSISLFVSKNIKGNSLDVVDNVRATVDEFRKSLPPGLSLSYFNDTTVWIRDSLSILGWNSVLGFVFLIVVLLFFLGFRNSLITALGIPLTFAITFMFMEWYGESLNGNSLFALVLVLGMIVDHAIVIMENSYRHRQMGLSPDESAIKGTDEVVKPVMAATLTSIAAFLPLMLLPGIMGKFLRAIPMVVSLALVASTAEALLFLPVHFAKWGGKVKEAGTGFIGRWQHAFQRTLQRIYNRRYLALGLTFLILILTAALTPLLKQDLFSGEEFPQFFVDIKLRPGTPRSETNRVVTRFEERLLPLIGNGEVVSIISTVGFMQTDTEWLGQSHFGQLTVELIRHQDGRKRPIPAIIEEMESLCSDIPGAESVAFRMMRNGPPVDKPISFRLQGNRYADMVSIANEFKRRLGRHLELYNIEHNYEQGGPELRISVNHDRAAALGLNVGQVGMYVRNCFEGAKATTYYDKDEEVDVIVRFPRVQCAHPEDVMQMKFPTPDGRLIPFSAVCSATRGTGIAAIKRTELKREVTISADAHHKRNIRTIMAEIQKTFTEKYQRIYPDISLKMGGEFQEFNVVLMDILRLFWIGLFLMYLVLGAQFKSFLQPFLMFFTIPFAFVGCVSYLLISGTPISVIVLFAGVALAGIAVNDSIVLISFVNGLRRAGKTTAEAVIEAAGIRLRPIILTSVTTIGGLAPMAIGLGGSSPVWAPMASTVIFGLLFSTVGTLVVIPCAYGVFDDIAAKFGRTMQLEGE